MAVVRMKSSYEREGGSERKRGRSFFARGAALDLLKWREAGERQKILSPPPPSKSSYPI